MVDKFGKSNVGVLPGWHTQAQFKSCEQEDIATDVQLFEYQSDDFACWLQRAEFGLGTSTKNVHHEREDIFELPIEAYAQYR